MIVHFGPAWLIVLSDGHHGFLASGPIFGGLISVGGPRIILPTHSLRALHHCRAASASLSTSLLIWGEQSARVEFGPEGVITGGHELMR